MIVKRPGDQPFRDLATNLNGMNSAFGRRLENSAVVIVSRRRSIACLDFQLVSSLPESCSQACSSNSRAWAKFDCIRAPCVCCLLPEYRCQHLGNQFLTLATAFISNASQLAIGPFELDGFGCEIRGWPVRAAQPVCRTRIAAARTQNLKAAVARETPLKNAG